MINNVSSKHLNITVTNTGITIICDRGSYSEFNTPSGADSQVDRILWLTEKLGYTVSRSDYNKVVKISNR